MTSGKQARKQRQAQRPPVSSKGGGRKASPKVLLGAAAGIAGIAAAIALVVAFTGGSSSPSSTTVSTLPDAAAVTQAFKGIPQQGNVLLVGHERLRVRTGPSCTGRIDPATNWSCPLKYWD